MTMRRTASTSVQLRSYGPPVDLRTLKDDIAARRVVLLGRLEQIGRYALEHPENVAFGTCRQIAASVGASPSSVSRFARALGFTRFVELRAIFRAYIRDR
jgi:DNA-binding MurR/RpiR family transcriptional regulator